MFEAGLPVDRGRTFTLPANETFDAIVFGSRGDWQIGGKLQETAAGNDTAAAPQSAAWVP